MTEVIHFKTPPTFFVFNKCSGQDSFQCSVPISFYSFECHEQVLLSLRANFLSSQKLLAAIILQKKSIMQVLAANILMRISIVEIVCECFLP